jgi:hypothetical protein
MQAVERYGSVLDDVQIPEGELLAGDVRVIYGASAQMLPLSGMQVSEARALLESILQVDPKAPALVNGKAVKPNHRIVPGDALEFVHHAGEKG